jgi:hypothetical protein
MTKIVIDRQIAPWEFINCSCFMVVTARFRGNAGTTNQRTALRH